MKKIITLLFVFAISLHSYSQSEVVAKPDTAKVIAAISYVNKQLSELSKVGVESKNDSLIASEEVMKLLKDDKYRKSVYPDKYEWKDAVALFRNMEFKRAFWHLINLYDTDKEKRSLIIGLFCAYDSVMLMDKVLLNTFYTYALPDPRVCRITDNKPEIYRPDLLEQWLRNTKEILGYIDTYREQKNKIKKP